jgi:DNA helicase-2/ATP-dependent DNA helicase PcrA
VFAERTQATHGRVEIRTIDSVIGQIAAVYHASLDLPADTATWIRHNQNGHQKLATRVAKLLKNRPMIAAALARRHPVVICDEHQDSSGDQHAVIMALLEQGAKVRIFADPMQKIFREKTPQGSCPPCDWDALGSNAQAFETLDYPHRWDKGCPLLGKWTLNARERLKANERIDLSSRRPQSIQVIYVENIADTNFGYRLQSPEQQQSLYDFAKVGQAYESLLILTRYNETALSLRAFFGRSILLWEGHTRHSLEKLVNAMEKSQDDGVALAEALVTFMDQVGKGFSPSAFGDAFINEVREGCVKPHKGKPALIQELARFLVNEPSHRGVAKVLAQLRVLKMEQKAFKGIEIDCQKEFWEAVRLAEFDKPDAGLIEITNRRTYSRPKPPTKAISNIHMAKGLESDRVLLLPCDSKTFPDKPDARCLLYVALSRAKRSLMLVVSRDDPSPLFII